MHNEINIVWQLGVDFALDNFAECPPHMRKIYHDLAEAVNMPRLAHPDNYIWPSSQVNMAIPQRHESSRCLSTSFMNACIIEEKFCREGSIRDGFLWRRSY